MPIPLILGGVAVLAAGGTGYILGVKTSNIVLGVGLVGGAYLALRYAK